MKSMKTDTLGTFRQIIQPTIRTGMAMKVKVKSQDDFENNDGAERKRVAESKYVGFNCCSIGTEVLRCLVQRMGPWNAC